MTRQGLQPKTRWAVVAAAALAGCVAVLTVAVLSHPEPFAVDERWASAMASTRSGALTFVAARLFYPLGVAWVSVAIVAGLAFLLRRARGRGAALVFVLGEGVSVAITTALKIGVDRERPPDPLLQALTASFPSGHTAFATVTGVLLVGFLTAPRRRARWAFLALGFALAMGWSRTYLMAHWLTDVAAGLATGSAVGLGALAYYVVLRRRAAETMGNAGEAERER